MNYKELKPNEASNLMQTWIDTETLPSVNDDEMRLRLYLEKQYEQAKEKYPNDLYKVDMELGLALYSFLDQNGDFTMRIASNDGFWRYLSLVIVPHLVSDRWGKDNDAHFWSRTTRIWVRVMWWYVFLSWQGSVEKTRDLLEKPAFTTDEILNLVERCGRKGAYVDVYREIMKLYGAVPDEERKKHAEGRKTLFRKVMILNTARYVVIDPYLMGLSDYVKSLYEDLGVSFE